ncbi:type II toxin-antitoxin system RelE/ParE family toxin [Leptogranulimonas caecicola]|nr:type II toxin-antitoxin system RelE/ParE family toxin [Leptogranulimonas caecicola]
MDKQTSKLILDRMDEIAALNDPRSRGKALEGTLTGFWRYRINGYRVICSIEDSELVILAVSVDHRSKVYKRH